MLRLSLRKTLAVAFVTMSAAIFCFRPLTPEIPQAGLDASWVVVMGEAAERHLRWGVDLAFPYGPASSLLTKFGSSIYFSRVLPLIGLISVLFGWGAVLLAEAGRPGEHRRGVPVAAILLLVAGIAGTRGFPDVFFTMLPLVPFLLALEVRSPTVERRLVASGLAVMVGVAGMAKMSTLLCALPLFILADLALGFRQRPVFLFPLLVLGFAAGGLMFGQTLGDLPAGLSLQWSVVTGYSEAMAEDGSRWELAAFGLATTLLLALVLRAELRPNDPRNGAGDGYGPLRTLGLGVVLLLLFKAGFVRQDLHTLIAWNGLGVTAIVVILARSRLWSSGVSRAALAAAVSTVLLVCPAIAISQQPPDQRMAGAEALYEAWLVDEPMQQARNAAEVLTTPSDYLRDTADARAAAWARVADAFPLPRLAGRVDTIPSVQSRVIANGLDYRPRPSFQEYATYTAALAQANRGFVEGPLAPDWILFGPEPGSISLTLERRFPNFAEGALWPDLLRLYRPARHIDALLALQRRREPGATTVETPRLSRVGFNQPVEVPAGAPSFASVVLHPNLLGRIAGLLFRPAPVVLTVRFADQHQASYQFISGIGEGGFVLSPLVSSADDFEALADGKTPPPDRTIVAFSIDATWKMQAFFSPEIDVAISALRIAPAEGIAPEAGLL